jgi:hypothetical protein
MRRDKNYIRRQPIAKLDEVGPKVGEFRLDRGWIVRPPRRHIRLFISRLRSS